MPSKEPYPGNMLYFVIKELVLGEYNLSGYLIIEFDLNKHKIIQSVYSMRYNNSHFDWGKAPLINCLRQAYKIDNHDLTFSSGSN